MPLNTTPTKTPTTSYAIKGAAIRFGRVLLFGAVTAAVQYAVQHLGDYQLPALALPFITAAIAAVDKWARESLKDGD